MSLSHNSSVEPSTDQIGQFPEAEKQYEQTDRQTENVRTAAIFQELKTR